MMRRSREKYDTEVESAISQVDLEESKVPKVMDKQLYVSHIDTHSLD